MSSARQRRWAVRLGVGLLSAGVCGFGIFWLMLSAWTQLDKATEMEAQAAFSEAVARSEGGTPFLEIPAGGPIVVHREQERASPVKLNRLHLLVWEPQGRHLLKIDFPFWFVRAKMTRRVNLGTLTTAVSGDWQHIDLRVTEEDLERRGPGLILDTSRDDGVRFLLWTE
ncbi:MAG: hypothetical protein ACE5ID_05770 [Acidobacteriota bacterium]